MITLIIVIMRTVSNRTLAKRESQVVVLGAGTIKLTFHDSISCQICLNSSRMLGSTSNGIAPELF